MTDLDISDQLRFVLVIEKEAIFRSLATASFHSDDVLGHSVLITGKGYPDIASRELVHTLCLHLPEK
jgi:meiotic recombination protein SPO11